MADVERKSMEYDVVDRRRGSRGPRRRHPPEAARPRPLGRRAGEGLRGRRPYPLRRGSRPLRPRRAAPRLAASGARRSTTPVTEDRFYLLGEGGQVRIPNWPMPKLMSNHGNFIVSMGNVCRWMAEQAEALGVEIFPGMAASRPRARRRPRRRRRRRRVRAREGRHPRAKLRAGDGAPRQVRPASARASAAAWRSSSSPATAFPTAASRRSTASA